MLQACLCIKKIDNSDFEVNHKYFFSYISSEYFPQTHESMFLIFAFGGVTPYSVSDFNTYFIDVQQHRQNLINQLLC